MNNIRKSINKTIVVLGVFTSLVFVSCEDEKINEDNYGTEKQLIDKDEVETEEER